MEPTEGARTFLTSGDAYDHFMGRYSRQLATAFVDAVGITADHCVLDVGCGPGALTGELVARFGSSSVCAFDPSPPFVETCIARNPGVDVRLGRAEAIPFDDASFDAALPQLVMHFVSEPAAAMAEMIRVVRPGGTIATCVWDQTVGMAMLRLFHQAAVAVDPAAPGETGHLRFGNEGELLELFEQAGLVDVTESTLEVASSYADFDELWSGFLAGIGPAGAYLVSLPDDHRAALHAELFQRVGSPAGEFTLEATARYATGRSAG